MKPLYTAADLEELETVGSLPIVDHFLQRMGVAERLEAYLPHDDARLRLAPAVVVGVVVRNIIVAHRAVYAIGEWATPYDPASPRAQTGRRRCAQRRPGWPHARPPLRRRPGQPGHRDLLGVVRDFDVEVSQL
ncbi:MAG: hypothetical protein HC767_14875, partial [Akkermansiaceae bacterium]|nr:hypothetical protein [Akkermansiaceae bacterium]